MSNHIRPKDAMSIGAGCALSKAPLEKPAPTNDPRCRKVIPLPQQDPEPKKGRIPESQLIKKYITEKNEEALTNTFYTSIIKYARQKQFAVAERLREKLMELVPMALTEIIQTGEIIEQEKNAALDPEKMKPFADLFKHFTRSEATAFFFALTHREVKANVPVFEQCQFDDRLYFIQSGRFISSYYDSETRQNIDFAILQKGDIAGTDTFFNITSHSTTLTPIEPAGISVLHKTAYQRILEENPSIESKLYDFCNARKKSCRIDHAKRQARRRHKRYQTELKGQFQKIDASGRISRDTTNMNIIDISPGGLCFTVTHLKTSDGADLHKNWLKISASYKNGPRIKDFNVFGRVVSLQFLPFEECAVHVKFKEFMDETIFGEIIRHDGNNAAACL